MKIIISDIHNAVQNSRRTIEFLTQNSSFTWVGNHPISVVNEVVRVKNAENLKDLEKINFFNSQGFSKNSYTQKEIDYLTQNIPTALKTAYCLCLKKPNNADYNFKEKFQHDRWKKVTDEENFKALVEFSKFDASISHKEIETQLRDIMRSAKEIPSLKAISFVWIATLPQTTQIEDILKHYFLDNHIFIPQGRKISYIAWAPKLADINMRYFVHTP